MWFNPFTKAYRRVDKYEGRKFCEDKFKSHILSFMSDGKRIRRDIVCSLLTELRKLRDVISQLDGFRFYSR